MKPFVHPDLLRCITFGTQEGSDRFSQRIDRETEWVEKLRNEEGLSISEAWIIVKMQRERPN
jgi:hypothetical protein